MSITLHKNAHNSDANMHEVKGFPSGGKQFSTRKAINGLSEFQRDYRLPNVISTANGYDAPLTEVNGDIYLIESPILQIANINWQAGTTIRFTFDSGYDSTLYATGSYFQVLNAETHTGIWVITAVNASYIEVTNAAQTDGANDVTGSDGTAYITHEDFDPENLGNDNSIPSSGQVRYYSAQDLWYGDSLLEGDCFYNVATKNLECWNGTSIVSSTIIDSITKTANYTALAVDKRIYIDSSGGIFTLTLEANPTTNRKIEIIDSVGSCGTYNVTLDGNGNNILGAATFPVNSNFAAPILVWNGTLWNII